MDERIRECMHCKFVKSKLVCIDGLLECSQILDVCLDCKKMKENHQF